MDGIRLRKREKLREKWIKRKKYERTELDRPEETNGSLSLSLSYFSLSLSLSLCLTHMCLRLYVYEYFDEHIDRYEQNEIDR